MGPGSSAGTTPVCAAAKRLNQQIGQIAPFEIVFFNELNFPISLPFLQLLLAGIASIGVS
jgi:hypothetical protein